MLQTSTVPNPAPAPPPFPEIHIQPPLVYVQPVWEYKHLVRDLPGEAAPDETELNALGAQGWELVSITAAAGALHVYFKRLVR